MKFAIKHEIKGRIRIHLAQKHMTYRQADILQCYLEKQANISKASVYVRTQDVAVVYTGSRDGLIRLLSRFSYETAQVSESARLCCRCRQQRHPEFLHKPMPC